MCNKSFVRVKSISPAGLQKAFVPCGVCADCRTSIKSQWMFRLRVELEALCKNGWKIGFFTLTYKDESLPYIPRDLFKSEYKKIACFSKDDIREFMTHLKKWLLRTYGCKRLKNKDGSFTDMRARWFIAGEFGELRHRPHYHGLICFPPSVDPLALHRKIKELWYNSESPDKKNCPTLKGFVGPFDFNGDCHDGKAFKPFICESVKAGCAYASKYVCKDLAYLDFISGCDFWRKRNLYIHDIDIVRYKAPEFHPVTFELEDLVDDVRLERHLCEKFKDRPFKVLRLSDCLPFHMQSRSLGLSFLSGLTDQQKLEYLNNGYAFIGEDHYSQLPIYLKNKICFTPDYVFENGKRLVRRKATQFFRENVLEIFRAKTRVLQDMVKEWFSLDFWRSLGASSDDLKAVRCNIPKTIDSYHFSEYALCYYGIPLHECYDIDLSLSWYRRFDYDYVDITNCPRVPYERWHFVNSRFEFFSRLYGKYKLLESNRKIKEERELLKILDFHKH